MQERPDEITQPEIAPVSQNFALIGDIDVHDVLDSAHQPEL